MDQPVYTIDGRNFTTLEEFYDEVGSLLIPGQYWGRNLQAFDDILLWPKVTPYTLVWKRHRRSRQMLNYSAMADELRQYAANGPIICKQLELAERCQGPTLFDYIVSIIRSERNKAHVQLSLE